MNTLRALALLAACGAFAISMGVSYRAGSRASEAAHSAAEAHAARAALAKQKELIHAVDTVARDLHAAELALEERGRDADLALDRLHSALAPRDPADYPVAAAGRDDPATLRRLLASCAAEYRRLAGDADRLGTRLLSLQAYVRVINR